MRKGKEETLPDLTMIDAELSELQDKITSQENDGSISDDKPETRCHVPKKNFDISDLLCNDEDADLTLNIVSVFTHWRGLFSRCERIKVLYADLNIYGRSLVLFQTEQEYLFKA
ncbi:hypothetical protein HHI36_001417 [Cryptolaemus montrouzieri]|uniref:Uncharacterized protein n=1 Tax=Cryptolaemus montrouzieri TaxID=559131 RepID=A0ABD2P8C2_9CUCU